MRFGMMAAAAVAVVSFVGCNQVAATTKKQSDALTAVVKADCDKYQACGDINSDGSKKYSSRTDCETESKAYWNGQWPETDCDGKVNGTNLTACTDSITDASCSGWDRTLSSAIHCQKSDVCNGN